MFKTKYRTLADELERYIKRYEVLLERMYNVGDILTSDEIQWMKDFHNPERHIQGIYYQLRRVDDSYIDMILQKFDSLKRKEHGLKRVQAVRENYSRPAGQGGEPTGDGNYIEFYANSHRDVDTLVNDLVLAIHKKTGGINPSTMDRYVKQIRNRVQTVKNENVDSSIEVKAVINRSTNQIEIKVNKKS
ncbi:MAG: hypothetical protein JW737_05085 [Acidobacteria bacterium]|nr:hypothetical protein [Acidobacteriota bacterium]